MMDICKECAVNFCEECGYCHYRAVVFHRCSNFRVPETLCPAFETGIKTLERDVIAFIRDGISAFDTDLSVVQVNMNNAHALFSEHLIEWSEGFCTLYNEMLAVYRAHSPQKRGHYRNCSIGIGYSGFQTNIWVTDTVQPVHPTAIELVARFDAFLEKYISAQSA